jgi:transposase-like protein
MEKAHSETGLAKVEMPSVEIIQQELASAKNIDDFFGKEGIFARLFSRTIEQLLEQEMTEHLGYAKYEAKGRNSGNSRNGKTLKTIRTSMGEQTIAVPRDRNSSFEPVVLKKQQLGSNELEAKIIYLYAKGVSTRDIQNTMAELYGVELSPTTISNITDKVMNLVVEWQNRPLEAVYPIVYLDAIHINMRREGKVENIAVYNVLAVNLDGHRDVLGHWIGDGGEGAKFWLSVLSDLASRGVKDILIACVDGLNGFGEAINAIFPKTVVQRCVIHQIRNSLRYVTWNDQKAFMADLKPVYAALTREEAETALLKLSEKWGKKYAVAVRSWENNWTELSAYFDYPFELRRIIYTTNSVEGYHRQLRKVIKTKGAFTSPDAVRKLLFLAHVNITANWTMPIPNWAKILNQLVICFENRLLAY